LSTSLFCVLIGGPAIAAAAPPGSHVDTGDTAWVLASAALVLFMTPGLALFYAGMVRRKNVLGTMLHSFVAMALVTVLWMLFGYSLAFGDGGAFIGGLQHLGLAGVGAAPNALAPTVPALAFMVYQCMFAVITPALISGAVAERMRFRAYLWFIGLWMTVIYLPLVHWMWGGGWMSQMKALDFAGGAVVHVSSGFSALVACLVLGVRRDDTEDIAAPHNLPLTVLGAGILWFGWFGFNAGSALGANSVACYAFVNTNASAAAGMLAWMLMEQLRHGRPTALGSVSGAVAGLATITPAAGYVTPCAALCIGVVAGVVCFGAVELKSKLGYDDSLDVFGVHGIGGVIGMLAAGLLATVAVNPAASNGLLHGNPGQLGVQALAVLATITYAMAGTFVLLKVIGWFTPLRLAPDEESDGLDLSLHEEIGYRF
jgi:Amt family ammonium transporter